MSEAEKGAQRGELDSIQDVERLLLEAANAIQRLIAERDTFRQRGDMLESELTRLRERTTLILNSYRRLATEFVTQLQLLDGEAGNFFRDPTQSIGGRPAEQQAVKADDSPPPVDNSPR